MLPITLAPRSVAPHSYPQLLPALGKQNTRLQAEVAALAAQVNQSAAAPAAGK